MIAKVLLKYKEEECIAEVFRDGTAILESGEKISLSSDQMDEILKKVNEHPDSNEPIRIKNKTDEGKTETVSSAPIGVKENNPPRTEGKEKRRKRKKKEKLFPDKKRKNRAGFIKDAFAAFGIFSLILALVGGAYCLVRFFKDEPVLPNIAMSQGEMNAQELKEAESIVIVGRIYTESGEVQEVVLGYINTDKLSSHQQE